MTPREPADPRSRNGLADRLFGGALRLLGIGYPLALAGLLLIAATRLDPASLVEAITRPALAAALVRTAVCATIAAALSATIGVAVAYLVTRRLRPGWRRLVEGVLDTQHATPPIVLGLLLLLAFSVWPLSLVAGRVVYQPAAIVLAQTLLATAFVVPTLTAALDQTDPSVERIARALGCSSWQAFFWTVLPALRRTLVAATAIAWARCVGAFGPVLVFAGAVRGKTEVLSTAVYVELTAGDLDAAIAAALVTIVAAATATVVARLCCELRPGSGGAADG